MANNEHNYEEPEIIYIPDEEGNEEEFEVIMKFEVDDSDAKYMMVVPLISENEEEDEVYAFRYTEDGDDLQLSVVRRRLRAHRRRSRLEDRHGQLVCLPPGL